MLYDKISKLLKFHRINIAISDKLFTDFYSKITELCLCSEYKTAIQNKIAQDSKHFSLDFLLLRHLNRSMNLNRKLSFLLPFVLSKFSEQICRAFFLEIRTKFPDLRKKEHNKSQKTKSKSEMINEAPGKMIQNASRIKQIELGMSRFLRHLRQRDKELNGSPINQILFRIKTSGPTT